MLLHNHRNFAIFSNAEKFRCLYSYHGSCVPFSPKEYNYKPLPLNCGQLLEFVNLSTLSVLRILPSSSLYEGQGSRYE